ncbi:hypothetical protein DERP_007869 [Dermatophagoides pteronyssinus]|uniref:Uncharacterized protein n=1 Tax=Dermatophagoides pteronyssinus TaxID=6956 RepID=A0ABQ8ISU5_DERPT|nr:hypothetical protein DERP_007869 [Dermatophagoides pteronyssinus]
MKGPDAPNWEGCPRTSVTSDQKGVAYEMNSRPYYDWLFETKQKKRAKGFVVVVVNSQFQQQQQQIQSTNL